MSYFLGSHLNLVDQAKVQLILPAIFMILQFVLHESPEYHIKRKNEKVCVIIETIFYVYKYKTLVSFLACNEIAQVL